MKTANYREATIAPDSASPNDVLLSGNCLLVDGQAFSPLLNMALDSWLAENAPLAANQHILRIYRWSPAGISIGRNQHWERALDLESLGSGEVAVRRITGGRAIYHDSLELTYSFVSQFPERAPQSQLAERAESYRRNEHHADAQNPPVAQTQLGHVEQIGGLLTRSLLAFLRESGVEARAEKRVGYVPAHRPDRQSPHCFVSTARHEITADGCKVVASAQRVKAGRFFQHGSIKLTGAVSHPAFYERPPGQLRRKQEGESGNKSTPNRGYSNGRAVTGSRFQPDPLKLRYAFETTFGRRLTPPKLTPHQREEVFQQLADIDYIVGPLAPAARFPNAGGLFRPSLPHLNSPHNQPHPGKRPNGVCDSSNPAGRN